MIGKEGKEKDYVREFFDVGSSHVGGVRTRFHWKETEIVSTTTNKEQPSSHELSRTYIPPPIVTLITDIISNPMI